MLAWHRYLASHRDPTGVGLLTIYHGWESGMDNSPRWDAAYAGVEVGDLPPYRRRDTTVVADLSQRPTQQEYDRYLWIVEELKRANFDDGRIQETASFLTTDVFMSAVFATANDALAGLARRLGKSEADELAEYAERFRRGVVATVDPVSGLALDTDLRSGLPLVAETLAGFAPLICGGLSEAAEQQMTRLLESARWTGHPSLRHPVLPTTSPCPRLLARSQLARHQLVLRLGSFAPRLHRLRRPPARGNPRTARRRVSRGVLRADQR
jgi:hypothetical protein